MDLVSVVRNRHGRISFAAFRSATGANPIRNTAHVGSKYSFREKIDDGLFAWSLRGLPSSRHEDADLFVRAIFRAVPLSCMKKRTKMSESLPTGKEFTGGKVVDIAAYKRQRAAAPPARPIEFDSERRAA